MGALDAGFGVYADFPRLAACGRVGQNHLVVEHVQAIGWMAVHVKEGLGIAGRRVGVARPVVREAQAQRDRLSGPGSRSFNGGPEGSPTSGAIPDGADGGRLPGIGARLRQASRLPLQGQGLAVPEA